MIVNKEGRTVREKKFTLSFEEPATNIREFLEDNRTIEENVYFLKEFYKLKKRLSKLRYVFSMEFSYKVLFSLSKDLSEFIPNNIYRCKINAKLENEEYNILNEIKNKFPSFNINNEFEDTFKKETENLREKYIHKTHNLLYITTTDQQYLTNLTKEHIGKNKIAEDDDDSLTMEHSCSCNGCSGTTKNNPRYLCVSCRPGSRLSGGFCDYCYDCIQHMRNNDEIGQKIQEKIVLEKDNDNDISNYEMIEHKHTHRQHIYLMLIANCDTRYGYYDF